jgi:hypothetical protein
MGARTALKKLADRKEQEIRSLRLQLAQAEAYLQAIQDSMRVLPPEQEADVEVTALREGTAIAKARDVLKAAGRPLHILEILRQMGRTPNKQNRVSLSGSLAAYVRRNQVFRKAAPNTFTLLEVSSTSNDPPAWEQPGIPDDFGKMNTESDTASSFSPFAHNSPTRTRTQLLSVEAKNPFDMAHEPDVDAIREAVSKALAAAGHHSAAQLMHGSMWSVDGDHFGIEIAGMGKKMLSLTVNAAAERVIRATLLEMGLPTQFQIMPSAISPR